MKTELKRVVTQASADMLARWILKNLDWSGGNSDDNAAFLTSILLEHRRQAVVPEEQRCNHTWVKAVYDAGKGRTGVWPGESMYFYDGDRQCWRYDLPPLPQRDGQ